MMNSDDKPLMPKKATPNDETRSRFKAALKKVSIDLDDDDNMSTQVDDFFDTKGKTVDEIRAATRRFVEFLETVPSEGSQKLDPLYLNPVKQERQTESGRRKNITPLIRKEAVKPKDLAVRCVERAKEEMNVDFTPEDFEHLIRFVFDEIAETLLQGRQVALPPIGKLNPLSNFIKCPVIGVPSERVDNWLRSRVSFTPSRRFLNTLKVYELARRSPEEREMFKNAILEMRFQEQRLYSPPTDPTAIESVDDLEEVISEVPLTQNNHIVEADKE